jgi:hypothetical protein
MIKVKRIGELGTTLAITSNRRTLPVVRSVLLLLVTASVVSSSPILVTLPMEAVLSSETPVLTMVIRCNIPDDSILHSDRRGNIRSYLPNLCSHTISLGLTHHLKEMCARNITWSRAPPALKTVNLTAIYESIIRGMWDPQRLTTVWNSTACYRDRLTSFIFNMRGRRIYEEWCLLGCYAVWLL